MARRQLKNLDERILKKVIQEGAENGIEGVSTKRIASELGITEPTIYVHFKTKNNLLLSAFEKDDCFFYSNLKKFHFHSDEEAFDHAFTECVSDLIERAFAYREEVMYSFYYRHSSYFETSEHQAHYFAIFHETTIALFREEGKSADVELENAIARLTLETIDIFMYQVAKGTIGINHATARLLGELLLHGFRGSKKVYYDKLTASEKASLKIAKQYESEGGGNVSIPLKSQK
jgi:AcrR family transcriptional regulator